MGLPAFKDEFEAVVESAKRTAPSRPRPLVSPPQNDSVAGIRPSSNEMGAGALANLERFNQSMNKWRDAAQQAVARSRSLIETEMSGEDQEQIISYVIGEGLPALLADIEAVLDLLVETRDEYERVGLATQNVRDPQLRSLIEEIDRRQRIIFAEHARSAEDIREAALMIGWDHDPAAREVTGVMSSDEDIDAFFARL